MTRLEATNALAAARKQIGAVLAEYDPAKVERETLAQLREAAEEARAEEHAEVLRFLRSEGCTAYLSGDTQRQLVLADIIGRIERMEHRHG